MLIYNRTIAKVGTEKDIALFKLVVSKARVGG